MIIYEFSTWCTKMGDLFSVKEIEVEERPKSFIGKNCRILKSEIDILSSSFGNRMYRLDPDPKPYIEAIMQRIKMRIYRHETALDQEKNKFEQWAALLERSGT